MIDESEYAELEEQSVQGTIVIMTLFIILVAVLWSAIYYLLLERS